MLAGAGKLKERMLQVVRESGASFSSGLNAPENGRAMVDDILSCFELLRAQLEGWRKRRRPFVGSILPNLCCDMLKNHTQSVSFR